MRRIVIALGTTLSGLVLLFSWPTSTNRTVGATTASEPTAPGAPSGASSGTTATAATAQYLGAVAQTRWGPVQVQITVADGVVTDAVAVQYPTQSRHDQEINAYAIPRLESATVDTQGGGVDMISGATVTSDGYVRSLQDALDQAGL